MPKKLQVEIPQLKLTFKVNNLKLTEKQKLFLALALQEETNIMFVSVKERTNLIGIEKAMGAKNRFILFQFLFEAVILAVIGGVVGLFLVWIGTLIGTYLADDFKFILSFKNMFLGFSVSTIIGLVSGILPATSAAKLDPVEAIRSGM